MNRTEHRNPNVSDVEDARAMKAQIEQEVRENPPVAPVWTIWDPEEADIRLKKAARLQAAMDVVYHPSLTADDLVAIHGLTKQEAIEVVDTYGALPVNVYGVAKVDPIDDGWDPEETG